MRASGVWSTIVDVDPLSANGALMPGYRPEPTVERVHCSQVLGHGAIVLPGW